MTDCGPMSLSMRIEIERWPFSAPFRIAGYTREEITVLVVRLERNGKTGYGEAAGVRYRNDTVASMAIDVARVRNAVEGGITRETLQKFLPAGGARNALDCALWDLEAKLREVPVWKLAELHAPRPLQTMFTCGAASPEEMAAKALEYAAAQVLKLKLTGEPCDAERVLAVRASRPDVRLCVDANQAFTRRSLESLMPVLVQSNVALIEQPFPAGAEALLDGLHSPVRIAADESVQDRSDLAALAGRFQVINIKLDKCGGLTEALALAKEARALGLGVMVGCMGCTSLAIGPAFITGQTCDEPVDLDGPLFLERDRPLRAEYAAGKVMCSEQIWGGPATAVHAHPPPEPA